MCRGRRCPRTANGRTADVRACRTGSTPTRRSSRASSERIFGGATGSMSASKRRSPTPATSSAASSASRDVVAVRSGDGAINVLVNRCAHRGMQFCTATRGNAKEFVCPYHQWTYDLAGNLLGRAVPPRLRGQGGMPADFRAGGARAAAPRGDAPARRGLRQLRRAQRSLETYLGDRMLGYFDRVFDGRELWCSATCGSASPATGS